MSHLPIHITVGIYCIEYYDKQRVRILSYTYFVHKIPLILLRVGEWVSWGGGRGRGGMLFRDSFSRVFPPNLYIDLLRSSGHRQRCSLTTLAYQAAGTRISKTTSPLIQRRTSKLKMFWIKLMDVCFNFQGWDRQAKTW